mmetsp:Transcript_987/g.1550  ORF Transcript_987/g.1550 Transcript_987/m.1550 type:complete len:87 (-) Transcript_987:184-444(-)
MRSTHVESVPYPALDEKSKSSVVDEVAAFKAEDCVMKERAAAGGVPKAHTASVKKLTSITSSSELFIDKENEASATARLLLGSSCC